ncbi:MAG: glycosyltransferase, partial [Candidatus Cloacimonadia bacterium]
MKNIQKKAAIVYIGNIHYKSRILKQIKSLQKADINVILFLGNLNNKAGNLHEYDFEIKSIPYYYGKNKISTFYNQIKFCYLISKQIIDENPDFIECCHLVTLLTGFFVKRKIGAIQLIYDSCELALVTYKGIKKIVWKGIEKYLLKYCDVIIHAEENRLKYFQKMYKVPNHKLMLLENFPNKNNDFKLKAVNNKKINIIYLGAITEGRCYKEVVSAFTKMNSNVRLDIVGPGDESYVEEIEGLIKKNKKDNIRLLPPVPFNEISDFLKDYDIGLLFYENTNLNNYYCAPNKLYFYINNGMPVITNNYPGLKKVLEDNKIGICIKEINCNELNRAINTIISHDFFSNITSEIRLRYT